MSSSAQQMLEDIGYHVEENSGTRTMQKNMPEATEENPYPHISISGADDNLPLEEPFLIGYWIGDDHFSDCQVLIELKGNRPTDLLVPIARALELNRPK